MVTTLVSGSSGPGFEPWPGTLCCVLGQDFLLSQCLSPPRFMNGKCTGEFIAGSNPAMD